MKHKKIMVIAALLSGLGLAGLQAQQAVPATGGNASGSGGTASYTVGQVAYSTLGDSTETIIQGVQQAYEIQIVSGIAEAAGIVLVCNAFPNPATDFVKLTIENYNTENLTYQIYDASGKLIENCTIAGSETTITIGTLVAAVYLIKIYDNNQEIKSFKIIKNH